MHLSFRRMLYYGSIAAAFLLFFMIPDVIFELLFELGHFLFETVFELVHIVFEIIESILDKTIEHLFHTELQETQAIVFYLMLSAGTYLGYRIVRSLVPYCQLRVCVFVQSCRDRKKKWHDHWQSLSIWDKVKWTSIAGFVLYLLSFLFF